MLTKSEKDDILSTLQLIEAESYLASNSHYILSSLWQTISSVLSSLIAISLLLSLVFICVYVPYNNIVSGSLMLLAAALIAVCVFVKPEKYAVKHFKYAVEYEEITLTATLYQKYLENSSFNTEAFWIITKDLEATLDDLFAKSPAVPEWVCEKTISLLEENDDVYLD